MNNLAKNIKLEQQDIKKLQERLRRYECEHGVAYANNCADCNVPFPQNCDTRSRT